MQVNALLCAGSRGMEIYACRISSTMGFFFFFLSVFDFMKRISITKVNKPGFKNLAHLWSG